MSDFTDDAEREYGEALADGLMEPTQQSDNAMDRVLDVLYMQGEQAGEAGYNSATHQIASVNGAKQHLLKWRDEAKAEAQLEILMGFRRRDFADGNMYKVAVLDRVAKLRKEVE